MQSLEVDKVAERSEYKLKGLGLKSRFRMSSLYDSCDDVGNIRQVGITLETIKNVGYYNKVNILIMDANNKK